MNNWVSIYRAYSAEDLADEITFLKKQSRNPFVSQTEGNRSYSLAPSQISERLAAAMQVKQERANPRARRHGVADFSGIRMGG